MLPEQLADHKRRIKSRAIIVKHALNKQFDDAVNTYNEAVINMGADETASFYDDALRTLSLFMYRAGVSSDDQMKIFNAIVDALPAVRNRKVTKMNFLINQLLRVSASREDFHKALDQITQDEINDLSPHERNIYDTAKLNVALHTGDLNMLVAMTNE